MDGARDADADIFRLVDAVRGLRKRLRRIQLVHLFVVALLEIDDRAIARAAYEDHGKAIGRGVGQGHHSVEEPGGGDGEANARLLRQIPGDRGGITRTLLVAKAEVSHPFRLCQPCQIGDRDPGDAVDRVDSVEFQSIHHQVESVGYR
jgi:hypothetical protein